MASTLSNEVEEVALSTFIVETVAEIEKLYSRKQVEAVKRAISYSNGIGSMAMANMIVQARSKRVDGMDCTTEDIVRVLEIYGPSPGALRGKTCKLKKSRSPPPIAEKVVDSQATMHVDLIFLLGVAFLVSYVKPNGIVLCNLIKSKTVDDIRSAI
jgi:hypothetical protein